jgi:two-component system NarL family sensor kinase
MTLDNAVAQFYTKKNQELALAFANQAAVAIENARLYQRSLRYAEDLEVRVNERTRDLSTLYEITAVASTHPELEKILDGSLEILLDTLGCTSGAIFIKGEDGRFELKSHKGVPEIILPIMSVFENEDGFVRQVIDDPNPVFIRDLATSPVLQQLDLPSGTYSYAGVSIRVKNDVVGVLNTVHGDGDQFSTEDFALLTSVADQLGVVIENGRLHQQNQEVAVLKERERLARELHDSVTQSLYSLMLFAEASKELSKMGNGEKLTAYLDDIVTTAQQALKEMRLMLYELRAGALGEEGLAKAIRYRLEAVEGRSGMEANLKVELDIDIPPKLRRALYLIAQEALNNTLKHAKATEVFVTLGMQGNKLIMTIEDNGRGFSERTSKTGGMGLKTMRERIEAVDGNLNINSLLDVGTKIEISVDLAKYGVV